MPARKTHPAFIVDDLAGMMTKAKQAGYNVTEDERIGRRGRPRPRQNRNDGASGRR